MNPNYDEMANPDDTYVDLSFAKDRSNWRLPEQKKTAKQKGSGKKEPVSDTMQNIQLHLNTVPGLGIELPAIEDTPFTGEAVTIDDGFEERPSGPFPMILPNWPSREFRVAGIPDSELAAAQRGQRWNWHNENSFMPPGSEWNKTVWQGADRENQWLARMLRQQPGTGSVMSPIAQVRVRQQIQNQYDKLVAEYLKGNWDDPARAYEDFSREAARLREEFAKAGFDPEQLRMPPPVSGGRGEFTTKAGPSKLLKQWNYANSIVNEIKDWINSGKINDKKFMGSQLTAKYLDDTYETLTKYFKESGNAMADEEKKRLQIQVLPEESYEQVVQTIKAYQNALAQVMSSASAKDWSQNNRGKVNEIIEALGFDPDNLDENSLGEQMAALGGIIFSALAKNDELPHDVATDLQALNKQYDTYMANMMLAANVGVEFVTKAAARLGNANADAYNDQAFRTGRAKADFLGDIEDITDKIPKGANVVSRLLDPPQFIAPSLAKKPKGKAGTNPESVGENAPRTAGTSTNGVLQSDGSIDY